MSEMYVSVIRDDASGDFRAELRTVDTDTLILACDWRFSRNEALADARTLRRDDDKLAAIKKADAKRGGVPPVMRDRGDC